MIFYMIRVKHTEHYVGKNHPTYALHTDQSIQANIDWFKAKRDVKRSAKDILFQNDHDNPPYWFAPQKRAKVWTGVTEIKRFLGRCRSKKSDTFKRYEIEIVENGKETVMHLEQFIKDNS